MFHTPVGPPGASAHPRYAGVATLARLPELQDGPHADNGVIGVPVECGMSHRPGARFGPAHIREAPRPVRPCNPAQGVEPFSVQEGADTGDPYFGAPVETEIPLRRACRGGADRPHREQSSRCWHGSRRGHAGARPRTADRNRCFPDHLFEIISATLRTVSAGC